MLVHLGFSIKVKCCIGSLAVSAFVQKYNCESKDTGPSDSTAEKLLSMEYVFTMPLDENRITQQIRYFTSLCPMYHCSIIVVVGYPR